MFTFLLERIEECSSNSFDLLGPLWICHLSGNRLNGPLALVLAKDVLCGPTAVDLAPLAAAGACRTLSPVVIACLTLPCCRPCSLRRPSIVPTCISAAHKSHWQLRVVQAH